MTTEIWQPTTHGVSHEGYGQGSVSSPAAAYDAEPDTAASISARSNDELGNSKEILRLSSFPAKQHAWSSYSVKALLRSIDYNNGENLGGSVAVSVSLDAGETVYDTWGYGTDPGADITYGTVTICTIQGDCTYPEYLLVEASATSTGPAETTGDEIVLYVYDLWVEGVVAESDNVQGKKSAAMCG